MRERKKATILIVDDDKSNINILLNILQDYDVIACLDGKTAIEMAIKEDIDLILLDIVMPQMDGFEVCSILKTDAATENIPIIFLSAKRDMEDINRGFELGAVDYIVKPFFPIELKCHVRTHIKLQNYQRDLEKKNIELEQLNQKIKDVVKKDMQDLYESSECFSSKDIDLDNLDSYLDNISLD